MTVNITGMHRRMRLRNCLVIRCPRTIIIWMTISIRGCYDK